MAKAKTKEKEEKGRPAAPRPRGDAYVMMLFITLLAIAGGTVLMYLDYDEYGSKAPPKETIPSPPKLGDAGTKAEAPAGGGGVVTPMPMGGGGDKGGMP